MTRRPVLGLLMICCLTAIAAAPQNAMELYQRGLVQEQAAGNLQQAIELYQRAAKEAGGDRGLAARALIRAAASYEKLSQPEAAQLYTEVVRTYPEQREQVAFAQLRLVALKRPSARAPQNASANSVRTDVSSVMDPLFVTYCVTCHNATRKIAGLSLDTLNSKNVGEDTAGWENILRRLRARRDPPSGSRRPDEGDYQSAISTLELALDQAYPENASLRTAARVTDSELAARMAGFIWGGEPDAVLLDAAQKGRLREPAVLEQQVRRMLRDSRASGLVTRFFEPWLYLDSLDKANVDDALRQALRTETRMFLESQLREDHNALDLWTSDYSFLNERLARHYGISGVSGNEFRRITLTDTARAGLLGQGSLLTVTSNSDRTSPTLRGKWITVKFLGIAPPAPPPNVPALRADTTRTMRARMEEHRFNATCESCHSRFEPLGLALENFNLNGQWRTTEAGVPIDASGTFVDGTPFNGPAELRAGLVKYRDAYYSNITQSVLGYALGRKEQTLRVYDYEMPSVRAIVREASANNYRWSSIILGIVKSTPFQMKNVVP